MSFKCSKDCKLFRGNCGYHHYDPDNHIVWDCPNESMYDGVIGDIPKCFTPSDEFVKRLMMSKRIPVSAIYEIQEKINKAIDDVPMTFSREDADSALKADIKNIIDKEIRRLME